MFAPFPKPKPISQLECVCAAFREAYSEITAPIALCDGLEIVVKNPAFSELFNLTQLEHDVIFLNALIEEQDCIETLFAHPKMPIDISQPQPLTLSVHRWAIHPRYWLLNVENRAHIESLQRQLRFAQSHDLPTGTPLLPAFRTQLQRTLHSLHRTKESGLLCEFQFVSSDNRLSGLNAEQRDTLINKLVQEMRREFGRKTLISRVDTLAITLFVNTSSGEQEAQNIVSQIRRLGLRMMSKETSRLMMKCGAALFPQHAQTVSELFNRCRQTIDVATPFNDRKSYQPKLFTTEIGEVDARRLKLAKDMFLAISAEEIAPHFQPIIDATTNTILSFEALIRWHHPTFGSISPPEIIALAEENDLLNLLTEKTMAHAAQQARHWPDTVQFAVNVTPAQMDSALVNTVRRTVRNAQIDPGRLEIEVTEDALIVDFEASAKIFARLRAIGVTIAMDDFGAGYTSLGNLRKLDFNKLKIDKSIADGLPHDKRSVAIVRSLMSMARELEVSIVVEGIEHEAQLQFLSAFNCGIQGYIYSPPVPVEQLSELRRFLVPSNPDKKYLESDQEKQRHQTG